MNHHHVKLLQEQEDLTEVSQHGKNTSTPLYTAEFLLILWVNDKLGIDKTGEWCHQLDMAQ